MDTSRRFTSPRLNFVKAEGEITQRLTPNEMAQLLFDELRDLESKGLLPLVADRGNDTGVAVDSGRRTVPFSDLDLPLGTNVASVSSSMLESTPADRYHTSLARWGVLLLACKANGHGAWIWSEVWVPYGNPSTYQILDVEDLTKLLTPQEPGGAGAKLYVHTIYDEFFELIVRKLKWYWSVGEGMSYYAARCQARQARMPSRYSR